jgi:CRP-like cAMP-binding protein
MTSRSLTPTELERIRASQPAVGSPSQRRLDTPFLRLLAETDRDILADLMSHETFEPGEIIFEEGEWGNAMYIILSGRTAVVKGDFSDPTILGYRSAGEIFGEMSLLENQPRSACIVAMEELRTLKIGREDADQ